MTDDLQSWNEVPRIAHFCSLFRRAFDLLEFDIQELEESLLLVGNAEDDEEKLVPKLVVKLLRGCSRAFTKAVDEFNYNTYLRRLFLSKSEEAEEDEIDYDFECEEFLEKGVEFEDLTLRNRVRVLHELCEFRLDAEDVSDKVKNLEASSLRVEPLGKDSDGSTYWYFYGTRLYKETPAALKTEDKKKRKEKDKKKRKKEKKEKKKKKKKNSHSSSEDENNHNEGPDGPSWAVVCLTLQDWEDLTEKMKLSKKKHDRDLYLTLSENFLPEIIKMFADKEREERRRLMLLAPKRTSSRIERKKTEQEERDRLIAEQLEEERRLEEEYDQKMGIRRGRKGRKSDEFVVEKNRSERMRQREQMKELRAKKLAEKEVEKVFPSEVQTQKRVQKLKHSKAKSESDDEEEIDEDDMPIVSLRNRRSNRKKGSKTSEDEEEDEVEEDLTKDNVKDKPVKTSPPQEVEPPKKRGRRPKSPNQVVAKRQKKNSESEEEDEGDDVLSESEKATSAEEEDDDEEDETYENVKPQKTNSFANALLKVGTKSTRDSNLEKPVRKSPGRLLQTAGLQKRGTLSLSKILNGSSGDKINGDKNKEVEDDDEEDDEPKISFGLYGGHLPVDIGGFTKSSTGDSPTENRLSSTTAGSTTTTAKKEDHVSPVRKVFSNWGGEFFKKNLDYRANTNKILEKMNLTTTGGGGTTTTQSSSFNNSRKEFLSPFKKSLNASSGNSNSLEEKKPTA